MKFAHLLEMNMVPEWRDKYIDYKRLDAALNKAIEQKDRGRKGRELSGGIDSYFRLIKSNQKFANYFSKECHAELDKVNSFHKEKLLEMKGKHNNLQDQLEQVLSSAIYKEFKPKSISASMSPSSIKSASHSLARTWRQNNQSRNNNRQALSANASPIIKSRNSSGDAENSSIKQVSSIGGLVSNVRAGMRRSMQNISPSKLLSSKQSSGGSHKSNNHNRFSPNSINHLDNQNLYNDSLVQQPFDLYKTERRRASISLGSNEHYFIAKTGSINRDEVTSICISPPGSPCPPEDNNNNNNGFFNDSELSNDEVKSIERKLSASLSINNGYAHNNGNNNLCVINQFQQANDHSGDGNGAISTTSELSRHEGRKSQDNHSQLNPFFEQVTSSYNPKLWSKKRFNYHQRQNSGSFVSLSGSASPSPNFISCSTPEVGAYNGSNNAQSRKQIIAFHKAKVSNLKFAFQELYLNLVLFEQYTQLNYAACEQILRKHDRMFASSLGRKFYQEHVQTADFYNNLQVIDQLIENVEHIYTLNFEDGNRRRAIEKLYVPPNVYKPSSPMLDFRVGFELGCSAILFILVILIGLLRDRPYDWRTVFRLYRSTFLLIIFLFQTGISLIIWNYYKINHVLIFELNPRNKLSFQHFLEFASLLAIIWSLSVLAFLFSEQLNIPPALCPLFVVVLVGIYLFNPMSFLHHKARFWLLRIMTRIIRSPFHGPVKFADFWIADQLVSIVPLFLDLEYLSCFYMSGDEVLSVTKLTSDHVKRCVTRNPQDLVIRTIVAALPAWFRMAQCLRRWRDENWLRFHLANAMKYGSMVLTVILSSIAQYNTQSFELETMRCVWLASAIFTSSLMAYWDIIYDFGLFNTYDNDNNNSNSNNKTKSPTSENTSDIESETDIKVVVQPESASDHGQLPKAESKLVNDSKGDKKSWFQLHSNNKSSAKVKKQKSAESNNTANESIKDARTNLHNKASITSDTTYSDLFGNAAKKTKTYPFLRKQLVYPVWVYYFAIVENWILRFGWIFTISLTEFSGIEAGLVVSLLAPLEMFRRFVWNCIRLENEQLNNCGLFRAVRDIPIEVVAPIDESQLDKVIMMMDTRDGPSMRSRLMKRRALRPECVSFMVLNSPDENNSNMT